MARRKQSRPTRPKRPNDEPNDEVAGDDEEQVHRPIKRPRKPPAPETDNVMWRNVLLPEIRSEDGKEVAEINLLVVTSASECTELTQIGRENVFKHATPRVRVQLPTQAKGKLYSWAVPEVSRQDLRVQVVACRKPTIVGDGRDDSNPDDRLASEIGQDSDYCKVILTGEIDGPDSALTALSYLTCQGYTSLRPAPCLTCGSSCSWDHEPSGRLRVLISKKAFVSFEGNGRKPLWMKLMQKLISWLRPELVCAMRTRGLTMSSPYDEEITENFERLNDSSASCKQHVFDPSALYDAIKPSCSEPALDMTFPELLPDLRPYQRRAAYWMVQRERGFGAQLGSNSEASKPAINYTKDHQFPSTSVASSTMRCYSDVHPLWFSVLPPDGSPEFFFNPYTGAVSLEPHDFVSYVKGGILAGNSNLHLAFGGKSYVDTKVSTCITKVKLCTTLTLRALNYADEMGLGKTVELLACILANPYKNVSGPSAADAARELLQTKIASRKCERVECACGAVEVNEQYMQTWVQCDVCDAWQHATCVGYECPAQLKGQSNKAYTSTRKMSSQVSEPAQGSGEQIVHVKRREGSTSQIPRMRVYDRTDFLKEDKHVCGACAELMGSVEVNGVCRATLVVCPTPILQQWQDEILRHTRAGSLRVIVYEGVAKGAFIVVDGKEVAADDTKRLKVVSAHELAAADIVLTTYDTLKTDLSHDSDTSKSNHRSLRYIKRYPVVPTPLTRLTWWRVCLDEAQMVESSSSMITEMALLLDAQNRWCVTGTPIQRGLDDLFGLLRFLNAEPFNDHQNWNQALRHPYEAGDAQAIRYMHKFLRLLMWRSSKLQVKDELNLPPQEECLSWLHFSPVEAHFYRQQHEKCAVKARYVIAKYGHQHKQKHGSPESRLPPVTQSASAISSGILEGQTPFPLDVGQDGVVTTDIDDSVEQGNRNPIEEVGSRDPGQESQMNNFSTRTNNLSTRYRFPDADNEDRPLSQSEASILSTSLLRLRQVCCHPQVGSAGIRSLQQRTPMTMDEILKVLVDKAKLEAEEAQRALIGALNGLAALAAIDSDIPLAVSIYREALALTEESAADLDVDPLQKLHTLHNLAEIMGKSSTLGDKEEVFSNGEPEPQAPGLLTDTGAALGTLTGKKLTGVDLLGSKIPRTLRDDVLIKQGQEIRAKYMVSFHAKLGSGHAEFKNAYLQVSEAKMDCEACGGTNWWLEALTILERLGGGENLVYKIRRHLLETDNLGKRGRHRNASSLALLFQEVSGLKYVMQKELDAIGSARTHVVEHLKKLNEAMENPTAEDVDRIVNCPRDSESINGPLCAHCEMDDIFQIYENRLLLLRTSAADADGVVSAEDAIIAQHRILSHRRITGSKDPQVTGGKDLASDNDLVRNRRDMTTRATEAEVLRAPSETEQILSFIKGQILSFKKEHAGMAAGLRDAATKHLNIFEAMKKEYSHMRALMKTQREVLYALDELNMATTRLSLQLPGEKVESEVEKLVKLPAEEVPQRNVQLTCEKFDALKDLQRTKGQLRYLKGLSLARQQQDRNQVLSSSTNTRAAPLQEGVTPIHGWHHIDEEACPVCQDKLGSQLMVLPCGHLLCCKCCLVMVERTPTPIGGVSQKRITCPACRQRTYVADVAFVDNGSNRNGIAAQMGQFPEGASTDDEASMQVKGSYGTKIEAVVRRLLWLKSKDRHTKVIIFSTWHDVLNVLEHALATNKITFARVKGTKLNAPIQKFRGIMQNSKSLQKRGQASNTHEHVQVLLLPIERGGNGLNLIEAQHVILVEPLPNPAFEAQAINRVHRIGQTRATCVHRFIVSDTVEESVYWLGRRKEELLRRFPASGMGSKKSHYSFTLNDVSALFASKTPGDVTGGEANSSAAPPYQSVALGLTPAAAAAAAAEARHRLNVASQQVIA